LSSRRRHTISKRDWSSDVCSSDLAGDMDVVVAGGVESMTRAPMFSSVGDTKHREKLTEKHHIVNQGISAEMIADQWELSRKELDDFALQSDQRAINAIESGHYEKEIVPVEIENEYGEMEVFNQDEGPRQDTTSEILNGLKSVFKEDGKITAGNASQMSD